MFLILHGYLGSGPDHWQSWLAGRLRAAGERVAYPVRLMGYHHLVADTVGGVPLVATY